MQKNFSSHIGKMCIVKYKDASYSYMDILKEKISPPNPIISIGKLRRVADVFVDLSIVWFENKEKYSDGIIIPIKAVISIEDIS